jgi:alginate O-acetyltransferase complex protein AlgI
MLFTDPLFIIFLVLIVPINFALRRHQVIHKFYLLIVSWIFFFLSSPLAFILFIGSIVANYPALRWLATVDQRSTANGILTAVLASNLLFLGLFKYSGFFAAAISVQWVGPFGTWMPLAISFYTFHIISYTIDLYTRKYPISGPVDYAVYLSFFPHLIAGPIVRGNQLLPQLAEPVAARQFDWADGVHLFSLGFLCKVVADRIAAIIDPYWVVTAPSVSAAAHWAIALLYSGQIYGDFAGYSLMAMGIAKFLGYEFPENFNAPYTATSFRDFWRRWHITLSAFLRDYLYIFALGGNRRSKPVAFVNLGLTMLLGGLWHGAAWHFVVWGAIHGAALMVERLFAPRARRLLGPATAGAIGWLGVQTTVIVAWVMFRSPDIAFARRFIVGMFEQRSSAPTPPELGYALLFLLPLAVQQVGKRFAVVRAWPAGIQGALVGSVAVLSVMLWGGARGFIYFQF